MNFVVVAQVLVSTAAARFNDDSALVLQQESLRGVVEHLLVHVVHLLALDHFDDVQVFGQLLPALVEKIVSPLSFVKAPRAPLANAPFRAAEEQADIVK